MIKKIIKRKQPVKDMLFDKFKKSPGINVFVIKHDNGKDKVTYNKILSALKDKNYLNYTVNFYNIQVFLTDMGRNIVDTQDKWETDEEKTDDTAKK